LFFTATAPKPVALFSAAHRGFMAKEEDRVHSIGGDFKTVLQNSFLDRFDLEVI
jgi:hypothetical protein